MLKTATVEKGDKPAGLVGHQAGQCPRVMDDVCRVNDLGRLDFAERRAGPAHQCLEADDFAGADDHLRLEDGADLAAGNGLFEAGFDQPFALDAVAQRIVEGHDPTATECLGLVECHVGKGEEVRGIRGMLGIVGDADAGADGGATPGNGDGVGSAADDCLGNQPCPAWRIRAGDHDGELVAAQPADKIVRRDALPDPFAKFDEHPVSGMVPVDVVDRLEAIEVQYQNSQFASVVLTGVHHLFQPVVKDGTVDQSCQRIAVCKNLELAVLALDLPVGLRQRPGKRGCCQRRFLAGDIGGFALQAGTGHQHQQHGGVDADNGLQHVAHCQEGEDGCQQHGSEEGDGMACVGGALNHRSRCYAGDDEKDLPVIGAAGRIVEEKRYTRPAQTGNQRTGNQNPQHAIRVATHELVAFADQKEGISGAVDENNAAEPTGDFPAVRLAMKDQSQRGGDEAVHRQREIHVACNRFGLCGSQFPPQIFRFCHIGFAARFKRLASYKPRRSLTAAIGCS